MIGMKSLRTLLCERLMKAKFGPTPILLGIFGTNQGGFGILHTWVPGEIPWDLSPEQKPLQQEGAVLTKIVVLKRCLYPTVQQGLWLLGKEREFSSLLPLVQVLGNLCRAFGRLTPLLIPTFATEGSQRRDEIWETCAKSLAVSSSKIVGNLKYPHYENLHFI